MKPLRFCTLTGVDAQTDLLRVAELGKLFPFSEWGVLFSPSHVGKDNRYSDMDQVWSTGKFFQSVGVRCAVHLCGRAVREFVDGDMLLRTLAAPFGRIQLNLLAKKFTAEELRNLAARVQREHPGTRLILQMNTANAALCKELAGVEPFEFLFDASGGRGILRSEWPSLSDDATHGLSQAPCGFAGGLGAKTIATELPRMLVSSAGKSFWVDMEGKLRSAADWFDLDEAEAVLRAVDSLDIA